MAMWVKAEYKVGTNWPAECRYTGGLTALAAVAILVKGDNRKFWHRYCALN